MFNFGMGEIVLIVLLALIVVGPARLPTLMKSTGKALRTVRNASREIRTSIGLDELMREDVMRPTPPRPRIPAPPTSTVTKPSTSEQSAEGGSEGGERSGEEEGKPVPVEAAPPKAQLPMPGAPPPPAGPQSTPPPSSKPQSAPQSEASTPGSDPKPQ